MSTRLSPLTVEVEEPPKLRLSAERRFSASSKELRVRVEGSLNILTMVLPLSVGTFLIARSLTSENAFGGLEDELDVLFGVLGNVDQGAYG